MGQHWWENALVSCRTIFPTASADAGVPAQVLARAPAFAAALDAFQPHAALAVSGPAGCRSAAGAPEQDRP